ncbi:hypothetical protein [Mycobacteroides abscessus]|uniref:hypothetical protein n=1 Tax=Mycobacteroides abscessus TaxID=36809 RepID=UPI0013000800|nr:hypothetical protein [Mycobacteroides abscessus]
MDTPAKWDAPALSDAAQQALQAKVNDYLTNPSMAGAAGDRALDALLDTAMPLPAKPSAVVVDELEIPEWAREEEAAPSVPPAPANQFTPIGPVQAGGVGGQVELMADSGEFEDADDVEESDEDDPDDTGETDDEDDDDEFALWERPEQHTEAFEEVPVAAGAAHPVELTDFTPAPEVKPSPLDRLKDWWADRPERVRLGLLIAVPMTFAVLVTVLVMQPDQRSGGPATSGPPPTADNLAPSAAVSDTEMLPSSVDAVCPPGSSPDPWPAFRDDKRDAWVCKRLYGIDQQQITIHFKEPVVVSAIYVLGGWDFTDANGASRWDEHRLVTRILWRIGGTQMIQEIVPTKAGSTLKVPNLATSVMSATIQSTQRPANKTGPTVLGPDTNKVDDSVAVGRIKVIGHLAGGGTA